MPMDVMPGPEDPANVALPQAPMHRCEGRLGRGHSAPPSSPPFRFPPLSGCGRRCLFPASGMHSSFVRATNPHEFEAEGVRLLGTSGQNVDDMAKYCTVRDR